MTKKQIENRLQTVVAANLIADEIMVVMTSGQLDDEMKDRLGECQLHLLEIRQRMANDGYINT